MKVLNSFCNVLTIKVEGGMQATFTIKALES